MSNMLTSEERSNLYDFLDILCNDFIHNQLRCNSNTDQVIGHLFSEDICRKIIIYRCGLIDYKSFLFFNRQTFGTEKSIEINIKLSNKDVIHTNLSKIELSSQSLNRYKLIVIKNNKPFPFLLKPYSQITFEVTTKEKLDAIFDFIKDYIDAFDKSIFR